MHIYGYKNLTNGKWYIGKSLAKSIELRDKQHRNNVKRGIESQFYNAVRKYGWSNFEFNILAECSNNKEAIELERKFISEKDSYKSGYNATEGGDGGDTWSGYDKSKREHVRKRHIQAMKLAWERNRERWLEGIRKTDYSYRKTKEYRKALSDRNMKTYIIESPDKNVYEFKGVDSVKEFFAEINKGFTLHSCNRVSPNNIIAGKGSKGWKLIFTSCENNKVMSIK